MRFVSKLVYLLVVLILLAGSPLPAPAERASAWQSKVDAWVTATAASGETEFLIYLSEQADLSAAAALPTKLEKGRYVYEALTRVAQRTQGPVIAALQASGAEYRLYWVANMIWARGDERLVQALAARPDVAHLYANPQVHLDEPVSDSPAFSMQAPQAVEWNILKVNADDVWAAGYYRAGGGGRRAGYRLRLGSPRVDQPVSRLERIQRRPQLQLARCHPQRQRTRSARRTRLRRVTITATARIPWARWWAMMAPATRSAWRPAPAGSAAATWTRVWDTPATYTECYQWFIAPTDLNGEHPRPDLAPDVINNSWSCPPSEGCTDPNVLLAVVDNVRAAGILTAHSAGNSGSACSTINTPAAIYDSSFTVGSTDSTDTIASSSSRGPVTIDGSNRPKPDVSAPGVGVRSALPGTSYGNKSGTSMAAPHVAGLVALLVSARPWLAGQVDQLETIIKQSAVPLTPLLRPAPSPAQQVPNNTYGWGRIDAWAAYQALPQPALYFPVIHGE